MFNFSFALGNETEHVFHASGCQYMEHWGYTKTVLLKEADNADNTDEGN